MPENRMTALDAMSDALTDYQEGRASPSALCASWQAHALKLGLPTKFLTLMNSLLSSVQSIALFEGEACAFSTRELNENLHEWLQAARQWVAQQESHQAAA